MTQGLGGEWEARKGNMRKEVTRVVGCTGHACWHLGLPSRGWDKVGWPEEILLFPALLQREGFWSGLNLSRGRVGTSPRAEAIWKESQRLLAKLRLSRVVPGLV